MGDTRCQEFLKNAKAATSMAERQRQEAIAALKARGLLDATLPSFLTSIMYDKLKGATP